MEKCPVCGREFKSERGLKIHMARVHNIKGEAAEASGPKLNEWFK